MVLVADLEEKLCQLVEEFRRVCRRKNLRVNKNRNKIMKCTKRVGGRRINELHEEVDCFECLGSKMTVDVAIETEVKS